MDTCENISSYRGTAQYRRLEPDLGSTVQMDPNYLEAFLHFRSVPQTNGPLEKKYKEMIFIAINAATTHLHAPGVRRHIQNALKAGATQAEILEVIQLTTIMGIHAMTLGAPILQEEVDAFNAQNAL
ncbi:carboxymuconolactone decarboxylase family protein [Paracoccaceae bacterium]|nr:carboxymuconolactone decarboxylase family protein [Paracoccaceae bacterium]